MLRRRLLGALSLLSLILCGATVVLWVRSYFVTDLIDCEEPGEEPFLVHDVWSERGSVLISEDIRGTRFSGDGEESGQSPPTTRRWSVASRMVETSAPFGPPTSFWNYAGFWHEYGDAHGERWVFPLWPAAVLLGLLPAARGSVIWTRLHRVRAGLCPSCGYDWRATPGRCSECGWREVGGDAK